MKSRLDGVTPIILAAGKGTRMNSDRPKVLHKVLGRSIIYYILDTVKDVCVRKPVVVVGYKGDLVKSVLEDVDIAEQERPLGSADALKCAKNVLSEDPGDILVLNGDIPFVRGQTIRDLLKKHRDSGACATLLTARLKDQAGYGRVVRGERGRIVKIVEEQETSSSEEAIDEINVGIYCFKPKEVFEALSEIRADNRKSEYYLTDIVGILHRKGSIIESISTSNPNEIVGINSRVDIAEANRMLKTVILNGLISKGVTVIDPPSTFVGLEVSIGKDTTIYPYTIIEGRARIGECCSIGPFARVRGGVTIGNNAEIGNYVELVRTKVGDNTKIKHMSYLGDAEVGKNVNIGAGMITANFDGKQKHKTIIEDNAFIGVGSILIAPVKVGRGATVGAGCVVTKSHDVPPDSTVVGVPARVLKK